LQLIVQSSPAGQVTVPGLVTSMTQTLPTQLPPAAAHALAPHAPEAGASLGPPPGASLDPLWESKPTRPHATSATSKHHRTLDPLRASNGHVQLWRRSVVG